MPHPRQQTKRHPRQLRDKEPEGPWHVYIIRCSDRSLYTGITTDIERRYHQHLQGNGARYFWGRTPRQMVYVETGHTRGSAARREHAIKSLTRMEKEKLIAAQRKKVPAAGGNRSRKSL